MAELTKEALGAVETFRDGVVHWREGKRETCPLPPNPDHLLALVAAARREDNLRRVALEVADDLECPDEDLGLLWLAARLREAAAPEEE